MRTLTNTQALFKHVYQNAYNVALPHAAENNNPEMIKILILAGAHSNFFTKKEELERTALMIAVENGYWDCVKMLTELSSHEEHQKTGIVLYDNLIQIFSFIKSLEIRKNRLIEKKRQNLLEHQLITEIINDMTGFMKRLKIKKADNSIQNANSDLQKSSLKEKISYLAYMTPPRKSIFTSPLLSAIQRTQKLLGPLTQLSTVTPAKIPKLRQRLKEEMKKHIQDIIGLFLYCQIDQPLRKIMLLTERQALIDEMKSFQTKISSVIDNLQHMKGAHIKLLKEINTEMMDAINKTVNNIERNRIHHRHYSPVVTARLLS